MGTVMLSIALCVLLPLALLSVYLNRKGRRMMISLGVGIVACLVAYFINSALLRLKFIGDLAYTATISPVIEEILKFLPILAITSYFHKGRRGSASLAFAVGVGFCVVENFFYLMNTVGVDLQWVVLRSIGTGLMHCMSATLIGIGLFYARQEKHMRFRYVCGSLALAIVYHGLYNLLVAHAATQWIGIALAVCTYLFLFLFMNKDDLRKLLPERKSKEEETEGSK